jgi:hypothetical protein
MKVLVLISGFLFATTLAASPVVTADSPENAKARELVVQLGSKKYRDREKAAAELIRMGRSAKLALVEGKTNADPEVNSRCEQLLPQALALDLMFRIDRFLKDTDGKLEHDLPLWKTYREKVGSDENARKLFAEMLKANGALLEAVEEEPTKITEMIQRRYMEMYQEMFGNPFGGGFRRGYQPGVLNANELCCILFASSMPAYKPNQPDWMLSNLFTQPNFTGKLKEETEGTAYRKVFFHYLDTRMDDNILQQCVWMFCQNKIKEGADIIAKGLKDGKATQPWSKANAICGVGTLGTKDHIKILEPYIKDDSQVQQVFLGAGQQGSVKMRDVALAITIHLNGKNPKDYGFTMWATYPGQPIQYHQLGFRSDDERAAAFKKWEEDAKKPAESKKAETPTDPKKIDLPKK